MAFKAIQINCAGCGAQIEVDPSVRLGTCMWCGTSISVAKDAVAHDIAPVDYIFEDKINEAVFREKVKAFICDDVDTPDELYDGLEESETYLCFLPMFKYKVDWRATWNASAGYTHTRTKSDGEKETYTEWTPAHGEAVGNSIYCGPGSKTIENRNLAEKAVHLAETLEFERAERFDPDLLAGKAWLSYDKKEPEIFLDYVNSRLADAIRKQCVSQVPGDTHRDFKHTATHKYDTDKVLIPFWVFNYKWADETRIIAVEAVNGEIFGDLPQTVIRVVKAVLLGLVPAIGLITGLILAYKSGHAQYISPIWWGLLMVGVAILLPCTYRGGLSSHREKFKTMDAAGRAEAIPQLKKFDKLCFWICLGVGAAFALGYCAYAMWG